jgi:hypothetical protein
MNTYALVRPYPNGLSITDAIMMVGNKRRPIKLDRPGDTIDLELVDVPSFCRSSYHGIIRTLFLSGVISAARQKISDLQADKIQMEFQKLEESGGHLSGIAGAPSVVQLEPGIQVGVMNMPSVENMLPDVPTPPGMETTSVQLEPGIMVPGVAKQEGVQALPELPTNAGAESVSKILEAGLNAPGVVMADVPEAPKGKKSKKSKTVKEPAVGAHPVGEPAPTDHQTGSSDQFQNWKNNLDFQTQKTSVLESSDRNFLGWVASKDDSRQLQKIAQARLAELDALAQG